MPQPPDHLTTFDDVLREPDRVIAPSLKNRSRIGFFAAIYKNVTARIQQAAEPSPSCWIKTTTRP